MWGMDLKVVLFIFLQFMAMLIGGIIGHRKGRLASGIIWTLLFSFIGVAIVACLPNLKQKKEEEDLLAREREKFNADNYLKLKAQAANVSTPTKVRIAKDGNDLGEIDIPKLKLMLMNGCILKTDYFFDTEINEWSMIEDHPQIK